MSRPRHAAHSVIGEHAEVTRRWSAPELLDLVLDEGSYKSWDSPIDISGHPEAYQAELRAAAEKAGTDESVITGRGLVRGRPVVVVANEFEFLAGSIGRAAAQRIIDAVAGPPAMGSRCSPRPRRGARGCRRVRRRSCG